MVANSERKIRIAVVFGGRSTEHAISCVSAGTVMAALDPERYEVVPVGVTREGSWVLAQSAPLQIVDRILPQVTGGQVVVLPADPTSHGLTVMEPGQGVRTLSEVDVVFPVLHGAYGEDGTIQGLLEMAGVPYVGAGVLSSAVAMDKEFTKKLLRAEGLPVGDYLVVRPGAEPDLTAVRALGLPLFVKPARAGSSMGITRVTDLTDLPAALKAARAVDPKVLIEAAVVGREIECGVLEGLDGARPEASLPGEIVMTSDEHDWYDFEAKYLDDASDVEIPAKLSDDTTAIVRDMAVRAFTALDGAGLARVDFFVDDAEKITINEINTMPGFTPISLFAKVWAATGLEWPTVVERLVQSALRRGTGLR
ncbi:MAG TPA: D-alanine--D-alanine ligase family protein [Mycobacteriales bacterium]|nr:D-alanine--D-alanine ligase family protein [Mycobacteriales bacterium]